MIVTNVSNEISVLQLKPLEGKVAIVTGGSRGIGAAIVKELASKGATVVATYLNNPEPLTAIIEEAQANGDKVVPVKANVGNVEEAHQLVEDAIQQFGRVDILVNNAGITKDRSFRKLSHDDWNEVLKVNLSGAFNTSKAVIEHMINQNYGRIINISSIVGQAGAFGQTNYAASKAGLIGFTKSLALETASKGITVNVICPGYIETEMVAAMPDEVKEQIVSKVPIRRLGQPSEIAEAVVYLAGASFVTGQQLNVNGGLYM